MTEQTFIRTEVDGLLREIGQLQKGLADVNADAERDMAAVRERYAPSAAVFDRQIKALEARLKKLVRAQKAPLMGGADRVDLPNGAVLFAVERRVKRVKGMLERLKRRGFDFCIRTAESVNWAAVEELSDDALEGLGTEWVDRERFSYEIREGR